MKSEEQDKANQGEASPFAALLNSQSINTLEQLNYILFDPTFNLEYTKANNPKRRKTISGPINTLPVEIETFKQLFDYCCKQQLLDEAKQYVRQKYQVQDIIRTHKFRKELWLLLTKAKFKIAEKSNYYQTLKNSDYPQFYAKIIEADVKRTTEQKSQENQKKLSNILKCLAKRNPFIGYCQGMNFVINFLIIMQFEEEEIFWIAVELFEEILPKNYYTNMQGIAVDLKILEAFLKIKRPQIYEILNQLNISLSFFSLEWLVCLCTTILPYNVLMLLWDLIFTEGTVVLLKAVVVIIDELAYILFSCNDLNDFLQELQPFKKKLLFEETTFLVKMQNVFIDKTFLQFARRVYSCLMQGEPKDSHKKTQITCDPKWPICHQQLQKNRVDQIDPDPWVLKEEGPPKIIENYLELMTKSQKIHREDNREENKKLVIGRMPHTCSPHAYDMIRGQPASIQLNDYDSETNTFLPTLEPRFSQISRRFLQRASFIDSTFIFHSPPKNNK